jgi:hypothetical protein
MVVPNTATTTAAAAASGLNRGMNVCRATSSQGTCTTNSTAT